MCGSDEACCQAGEASGGRIRDSRPTKEATTRRGLASAKETSSERVLSFPGEHLDASDGGFVFHVGQPLLQEDTLRAG